MKGTRSVAEVTENGTCVACGGCKAVCESGAISVKYETRTGFSRVTVDPAKCTSCGRCSQVCPAIHFADSSRLCGASDDAVLGDRLESFLACSCDDAVRIDSSSGGVANALLSHLLDKGIVDTVILVKAKHEEPFAQIVAITDSEPLKKEPREFASRYVSVPLLTGLDRIKTSRVGIVCVPCQAFAARMISEMLKLDSVIIGIACSGGTSSRATLRVLGEKEIARSLKLYYRGAGWPGKFLAEGVNVKGEIVRIEEGFPSSRFVEIYASMVYRNPACWNCNDHFAENADVSMFDFWNDEFARNERKGQTGVIIRSEKMSSLFRALADGHRISVGPDLSAVEIVRSQESSVKLKNSRRASHSEPNIWARFLELAIKLHANLKPYRRRNSRLSIRFWSTVFGHLTRKARYGDDKGQAAVR